jgi:hypothetical protein
MLLSATSLMLVYLPCPLDHLQAQLVMLGPIGDAWGLQATVRLQRLMRTFPGRVYAPPNKYCAGRDKQLLLAGERRVRKSLSPRFLVVGLER